MNRRWLASLLIVLAVVVSSIPAVLAEGRANVASEDSSRIRDFLDAVSSIIARLRDMGVNTSKAEELLNQAYDALNRGDLGRARSLALQALVDASIRAKEILGVRRPVAAGVLMELATLRKAVESMGDEDLMRKLQEAEELLSRGLVNETVKILKEVREAVRKTQIELAKTQVERVRAEVEARIRGRIREEGVVEEFINTLRKAKNLSEVGRVLRGLRNCEKLREKLNISLGELDKELANLSSYALGVVADELGELVEEFVAMFPRPVGLLVTIDSKIVFVEKIREELPDDLKSIADDLIKTLRKLKEVVKMMIRCEEGYEDKLAEVRDELSKILETLREKGKIPVSMRGRMQIPPMPLGHEFRLVIQIYAVTRWAYQIVDILPKILVCPSVGSKVAFWGVVVNAEEGYALVFATIRLYTEDVPKIVVPELLIPARPSVRVGIFILDLTTLEKAANLTTGAAVIGTGIYVGYVNQSKYPVIQVTEIRKAEIAILRETST